MKYNDDNRYLRLAGIAAISAGTIMLFEIVAAAMPAVLASPETGVTHYADGVTVTKNADGSIEVGDSGSCESGFSSAPEPATSRHSSHVKPGLVRYSDGIVVRRNADRTVEVSDAPTVAHSTRASHSRSIRSKRPLRTAYRYGDGVSVRRNPDGTVEVYDAPGGGRRKR